MTNQWAERRGFTLMEMMVVIGIILILLMFLVPAAQRALERAKTTVCLSNLRNLAIAHLHWAANNGGYMCSSADYIGSGGGSICPRYSILIVEGYLGNEYAVFKCPLDRGARVTNWTPDPYRNISYMRNGDDNAAGSRIPLNHYLRPAQTMMLAEEYEESPFNDGYIISSSGVDWLSERHNGGRSGMAFMDGHERLVDSIEFNQATPTWRRVVYYMPQ